MRPTAAPTAYAALLRAVKVANAGSSRERCHQADTVDPISLGFVVAGEAMQTLKRSPSILRILVVLAIAQLIGWGAIGLPAVIGRQIAADLNMSLAAVFAGTSVLYVVMGLLAPLLARAFVSYGARRVMISGTVAAAPGFALLAMADGAVPYFAAWVILGAAGAATLSTAAYIMLREIAGSRSRGAIGALMLVSGLSSSIFWPTTAFLSQAAGWRATCLIYGAAMIFICLPLHVFGLPGRVASHSESGPSGTGLAAAMPVATKSTFYLIVSAIALNAFVTFGFSAVLIELLRSEGLASSKAIAFASALGVVQVGARGIDLLGGGKWDGVTTAIVAGPMLPVAMLLLMFAGGTHWSIAAFIVLYGLGSGALAVARATIPLAFYDKADYARAASHIALPLNLISALSPPVMAGLLVLCGDKAILALAMSCSSISLLIMLVLARKRQSIAAPAAA